MADRTTNSYDAVFEEEQGAAKVWAVLLLFALVIPSVVFMGWLNYQQLYLGKPWGNKPASDGILIFLDVVIFLTCVLLPLLVLKMKLVVTVSPDILSVKFRPIIDKRYFINDVESSESVTYRPIRDYGGWGIRYSFTKKSWAYNVSGNKGVSVNFKDGREMLIGSQRPDELATAILSQKDRSR